MYNETSIENYLADLAARKPAPGGGSASALAGATGTALISMVCNFTIGKEKYKDVEEGMTAILFSSESCRKKLIDLIDEDVKVYKALSISYNLPKDTSEEKRRRELAIQNGLKEALSVPFEICKACHESMKLCPDLASRGNINLISDVGVAIALLESAFQSALLNIEINIIQIKDEEFIVNIRAILEPMEKEVSLLKDKVWQAVKNKMEADKK